MSATWARSKSAGPKPLKLTDYVTTNAVRKLKIGQAHYSGLLYEHGGFVDDILVHKVADDHYFLCVNASNQEKDFEHIARAEPLRRRSGDRERPLRADRRSRGRRRRDTLQKLTPVDLGGIKYYWFADGEVARHPGAHRAHRLHRRGRLRDLRRRRPRPSASGTG